MYEECVREKKSGRKREEARDSNCKPGIHSDSFTRVHSIRSLSFVCLSVCLFVAVLMGIDNSKDLKLLCRITPGEEKTFRKTACGEYIVADTFFKAQ